jgi:hypothetical protein
VIVNESERATLHYMVDESALDDAASRALGIALIAWAASGADRFVATIDERVYADPQAIRRLLAVGKIEETPGPGGTVVITGGPPPGDFAQRVTDRSVLASSVSGDLTNVEDLALFAGERRRYLAADYGRTQLLQLDGAELAQLRARLHDQRLDDSVLIEVRRAE